VIGTATLSLRICSAQRPGFHQAAPEPVRPVNDDRNLVRRIDASDRNAFAELYDRHADVVYGICRRILKDSAAAEDVTQSVFTMLWAKPSSFAGGNFSAWITRVARNAALDVLRSAAVRTREPEIPPDIPAAGNIEDEVVSRLQSSAIADALARLPDDQRAAIEQAYFGGMSYREVAERLGAPLGTIKSRIRSGLAQLWQALQQQVAP
jgi:RNA polymerase sigma-70 factor, ECF subfamily